MDTTYLLDWVNLLLRWAHVIVAIAWIGSSFYFVFLDNSLTKPESNELKAKGVDGELWAVHGGGFYNPQKYLVAPKSLPEHLHWFFWESYSTWLTGFALFTVMYLFNARTFLIDTQVYAWSSPGLAVAAALAFLVVFWVAYDLICRWVGEKNGKVGGDALVGLLVLVYIVAASWAACQLFAGRAAFLMVGAMIATAMSANVFFWIIPGQKTVIAQMKAGQPVDAIHGQRAKQRSVHNTYFTLPVLMALPGPAQLGRAGAADAGRCTHPPQFRGAAQGPGAGQARGLGIRRRRHRAAAGPGGVDGTAAQAQGRRRRALALPGRGESRDGPALHAVPQRAGAAEKRRAAHARTHPAARAGHLPAERGAEADADEQRDADHRR